MVDLGFWLVILTLGISAIAVMLVLLNHKASGGPVGGTKGKMMRGIRDEFPAVMRTAGGQQVKDGFLIAHDGETYRFWLSLNSNGPDFIRASRVLSPSMVSGAYPELPVMRMRQENDRDRLGKALWLNREMQTGDSLFDSRIYVECDAARGAGIAVLSRPEVRQGVTGLLALGYREVCLRRYRAPLVATWQIGVRDFTSDTVMQTIERLALIGDHLPAFRKIPASTPWPTGKWVLSVVSGLALLMFWLAMVVETRWEPLDSGLDGMTMQLSILLLLLQSAVLWALLRGNSQSLRFLFWSVIVSGFMVVMTSRVVLVTYNGSGDTNISTYERALDHKRTIRSDDSTRYYFYFMAVPGIESSSFRLSVSKREYRAASQGDSFHLTVGAGKLDTPWLLEMVRLDQ